MKEDQGKKMETEVKEIEIESMEKPQEKTEEVKRLPPWTKQVTVRGVIASIVIGSMYSVIAMKLNLTAGLTPHLNVSAALLGFVFIRTWTKLLQKTGFATTPFTRQENTMIQTCSVACYSIAVGGLLELYNTPSIFIESVSGFLPHGCLDCRGIRVVSSGVEQEDV